MNVLIAGDFCDRYRISDLIARGNYASLFDDIKYLTEQADVSIINFEFPIVLHAGVPITKSGPTLQGQPAAVDAVKYAGFNVCTLANNHILDQGTKCCIETRELLENAGIKTVGIGKNSAEAATVLYINQKEKGTLAIVNCCEHEFSIATHNRRRQSIKSDTTILQYTRGTDKSRLCFGHRAWRTRTLRVAISPHERNLSFFYRCRRRRNNQPPPALLFGI